MAKEIAPIYQGVLHSEKKLGKLYLFSINPFRGRNKDIEEEREVMSGIGLTFLYLKEDLSSKTKTIITGETTGQITGDSPEKILMSFDDIKTLQTYLGSLIQNIFDTERVNLMDDTDIWKDISSVSLAAFATHNKTKFNKV